MVDWLQEAFSAPSDKARLVSILISVLLAISVLLLNQWFIDKRERKKIISEKIEEMYKASIAYVNAANELLRDCTNSEKYIDNLYEIDRALLSNLNDSIKIIDMLCALYFEEIKFNKSEYTIENIPMVIATSTSAKNLEERPSAQHFEKSKEHISNAEKTLTEICESLMRKHVV